MVLKIGTKFINVRSALYIFLEQVLTSYPRSTAMWKERSWHGMTERRPCKQSTVRGISIHRFEHCFVSSSPWLQIRIGWPCSTTTTTLTAHSQTTAAAAAWWKMNEIIEQKAAATWTYTSSQNLLQSVHRFLKGKYQKLISIRIQSMSTVWCVTSI